MKRRDDRKLDELLTGGYLAGDEYDRIFERVLAETGQRPPARRRSWLWAALAPGLTVASGLAVWLVVRAPPDHFGAKGPVPGSAEVTPGVLDVACAPRGGGPARRTPHTCRPGDTLMFEVNAAVVAGSLGAYAEPVGAGPGARIWYFPTAGGASPTVAPGTGTVVLPEGVTIGPEHAPGRYRITVWVARRPLGRAEIAKGPLSAAPEIVAHAGLDAVVEK